MLDTYGERPRRVRRRGIALLEVVLAVTVFFGMAVVILGGLNLSMRSVRQVKEQAQAADLAVTLLSYMQIGVVPVGDAGPTPFEEPFSLWTYQTVTAPVPSTGIEGTDLVQVEIVITNIEDKYTYRLYQWMPTEEEPMSATATASAETGGQP
jgi:hypothetical protein